MKIKIIFVLMLCFTVTANVLMKQGAAQADKMNSFFDYKIFLGLFFFGLATLAYLLLIRWLPLNVIQAFAAIQFVLIILASSLLLREPITSMQWVGMLCICVGIAIVGWSHTGA